MTKCLKKSLNLGYERLINCIDLILSQFCFTRVFCFTGLTPMVTWVTKKSSLEQSEL